MARPDRTRNSRRWPAVGPGHQLPPGSGDADTPRGTGPGLSDLVRSLADDMSTLVHQEIELAKMEAVGTAKRLAVDSAWIASGALVVAVGGLCLVLAMALGLGALLGSYWLGTLITGLVLAMLGGGFVFKGIRDLRKQRLLPTRTTASLREDARWAAEKARDFKERIKE